MRGWFVPNQSINKVTFTKIATVELATFLLAWTLLPAIFPSPWSILVTWTQLWSLELDNTNFATSMLSSLWTNFEAVALVVGISLGLGYLTALPVFRPIVKAISLGRFLAMAGLGLLFNFLASDGHELKIFLLTFFGVVFLLPAVDDVLQNVPTERFEHARTLRMSEWRIVWEVLVLGTLDKILDLIRGNAAMVWMMLTSVEVLVRYEGGVGVVLANQERHLNLEIIFAIQLMFLLFGLLQDGFFVYLKRQLCPHASLTTAGRK